MEDALLLLRRRGYQPQVIVDIGANVGTWTDLALSVFHAREHHLVEPQTACQAALARFTPPRFNVHIVALTSPGVEAVTVVGGGEHGRSTGAWIPLEPAGHAHPSRYPATSLDGLLGGRIVQSDRALVKLDVEGHELAILESSSVVLPAAEVVVVEFQMFEIEHNGRPTIGDVIAFMKSRRFQLYDVAAIGARRRDLRARTGDVVFVRDDSPLLDDVQWG